MISLEMSTVEKKQKTRGPIKKEENEEKEEQKTKIEPGIGRHFVLIIVS